MPGSSRNNIQGHLEIYNPRKKITCSAFGPIDQKKKNEKPQAKRHRPCNPGIKNGYRGFKQQADNFFLIAPYS